MNTALFIIGMTAFGLIFWKFILPDWRSNFRQLAAYNRQIGAVRFWLMAVGTVAFCVGLGTMMFLADWPADCDPHDHRFELFKAYYCSSRLLSGSAIEIATFMFLWSIPVGTGAVIIYYRLRKSAQAERISSE